MPIELQQSSVCTGMFHGPRQSYRMSALATNTRWKSGCALHINHFTRLTSCAEAVTLGPRLMQVDL